ncbi:hypothetical protein M899_1785 [Bacteriovorax sp. BSW11_IV]|uniref:iron-containing redox enzyme family protein n=1 Tax=Bacteriovorax sp. BSW11_IV TaxID=1353529 RepID=UPI00038A4A65|nr:iron-containing redox enzyme family protein [Bacteriovorax sp. BSW11_IV]EQC43632.1 hypothetical protein M899_1785 [Bacteriovorax sp. BSW11_IV]
MSMFDQVFNFWKEEMVKVHASTGFKRILDREMTPMHYAAMMEQIYHHTRENPQIQTFATAFFKYHQRSQIKPFYKHAISEIGHDQLALDDIKALGYETENIVEGYPLPITTALLAYAYYQIQFRNPIGYLGYLFHLEYMPTQYGAEYIAAFKEIGVPDTALSFIEDHHKIDQGHIKMMHGYIDGLIKTQEELEEMKYAVSVTAKLYSDLVTDAFAKADALLADNLSVKKKEYADKRQSRSMH